MVATWLKTIADNLRPPLEELGCTVLIAENLKDRIGKQSIGHFAIALGCDRVVDKVSGYSDASLAIGIALQMPANGEYAQNQIGMSIARQIVAAIRCIATSVKIGNPGEADIQYHGEDEEAQGIYWVAIEIAFANVLFDARDSLDLAMGRLAGILDFASGGVNPLPEPVGDEIQTISVTITGSNEAGVIVNEES